MVAEQTTPDVESVAYRRCADPRRYFAGLRARGPIDTEEGLDGRIQVLTADQAQPILHDHETFSAGMGGSQHGNVRPLIPLQIDPPDHARYRRLLDPVFAARNIVRLEPDVATLTNDLIDRIADRGSCDLSAELSIPLPSSIFLRLLGLAQDGLEGFLALKNNLIHPSGDTAEEKGALRQESGRQVYELFGDVLDQRTSEPRDDLITQLLHAEIEGERLSRDEVLDITYLLLMAGLDTVTISLQCMFHHLATHPIDRQRLSAQPDSAATVVEELMRWETPVQGVTRVALKDTVVAGQHFSAGTRFQVILASINTDPDTAEGYGVIDFDRTSNRHVAFGAGIHRCLGSHLARLELRVALEEWHKRIPEYEIDPSQTVVWNGDMLRGIDYLPLVWGAAVPG